MAYPEIDFYVRILSSYNLYKRRGYNMNRVVHFEFDVEDPERALKFYSEVFKWKIDKWGPANYWLIVTGSKDEPGKRNLKLL